MTLDEAEQLAVKLSQAGYRVAGVIHSGSGFGVALISGEWTDQPWDEAEIKATRNMGHGTP